MSRPVRGTKRSTGSSSLTSLDQSEGMASSQHTSHPSSAGPARYGGRAANQQQPKVRRSAEEAHKPSSAPYGAMRSQERLDPRYRYTHLRASAEGEGEEVVEEEEEEVVSVEGEGMLPSKKRESLMLDVLLARHQHRNSAESSPDASAAEGPRQHHQRRSIEGQPNTARSGTAMSVATTAMSSAMSLSSLARAERLLGKSLPLNDAATHVVLTKSDIECIKDPETLEFLRDNSSLFVKYFEEQQRQHEEEERSRKHKQQQHGVPAQQLADTIDALVRDIETFMTAVDSDGVEYTIHTDMEGVLHVPLEATEGAAGDVAQMADLDGAEEGLADAEVRRLAEQFGIDFSPRPQQEEEEWEEEEEEDEEEEEEGDVEVGESIPVPANLGGRRGDLRDSDDCSTVRVDGDSLDASIASTAKSSALPVELLQHGLDKRLQLLLRNAGKGRPRFMAPTKSALKKNEGEGESPPPAPPPKKSSFTTTFCNRGQQQQPQADKTKEQQPAKTQRFTLEPDEERRVQWLLDNEDWDKKIQACPTGSATSVASTAPPSSHWLRYDEVSASAYSAAAGGYTLEEKVARLTAIDQRLERLLSCRAAHPMKLTDATIAVTPRSSAPAEPLSSTASSPRRLQYSGSPAAKTPLTEKAQKEFDAAAKRKADGDANLQTVREERKVREALAAINDRLMQISEECDALSTPPFIFNQQYELQRDPASWEWPESVAAPSAGLIRTLVAEAKAEQEEERRLKDDDAAEGRQWKEGGDVVEEEPTAQPLLPIHEALRAHFERAQDINRKLEAMQQDNVAKRHEEDEEAERDIEEFLANNPDVDVAPDISLLEEEPDLR